MVTIWPLSSMTTPAPSRVEPRLALLRAPAIAFIFTRTTAEIISSASLSDGAPSSFDWARCARASVWAACDRVATPKAKAEINAASSIGQRKLRMGVMLISWWEDDDSIIVILIADDFQQPINTF